MVRSNRGSVIFVTSHIAMPSVINGTITIAAVSAFVVPSTGLSSRNTDASGSSIQRGQCIGWLSGSPMRYWVVSNQLCPPSQSRSCTMRS